MKSEVRVPINSDVDIMAARHASRTMAAEMGFSKLDMTLIATAISELARNIIQYAGHGEVILTMIEQGAKKGLVIVVMDQGPGIPNIERAMQDGFSTGHGLGLGLPGSRRLMDEFEIVSEVGKGTRIKMCKWTT
jgi:serine/threonine-protein kinase RsbT